MQSLNASVKDLKKNKKSFQATDFQLYNSSKDRTLASNFVGNWNPFSVILIFFSRLSGNPFPGCD